MKPKFVNVFRWFPLVIMVMFLTGCNLQQFIKDRNENYNPTYPTAFRCEAQKGLLFGTDLPKTPSYNDPKLYYSLLIMDFTLDLYFPEQSNDIIPMIDYSLEITSHPPIVNNQEGTVDFGIEKIYKSGKGQGFWENENYHGLFTGMVREKSKIEQIKPEGPSGEIEFDLWFVGIENFIDDANDKPQVLLCLNTGKFDLTTVKAAGEKGFAEFCSLPDYGYFVCQPR